MPTIYGIEYGVFSDVTGEITWKTIERGYFLDTNAIDHFLVQRGFEKDYDGIYFKMNGLGDTTSVAQKITLPHYR